MKRAIVGLMTAASFLCMAASGSADEVTITGGTVVVPSVTPSILGGTFDLIGSGFEVSGGFGGVVTEACRPCSGGPQGFGVGWVGDDFGLGPAIVAGNIYGNVFFSGEFSASVTAVLPMTASAPFTVTFPFVVNPGAHVAGYSDQLRNNKLFDVGLTGSGTATASFVQDAVAPTTLFDMRTLRLNFQTSTPSPTPEPASVLLVASGVGLVFRRLLRNPT